MKKKVWPKVYERLTPHQRLVACVEAEARDDERERRRLYETCPRLSYTMRDRRFTQALDNLWAYGAAVECDLRGCELMFLLALRLEPKEARGFLQEFSDIQAAWRSTLETLGVDPDVMERAMPPRPITEELLEGLVPPPDATRSAELQKMMLEFVNWPA